ncbi:MAG: hypothetical protein FWB90_03685 [Fibromonadales bacterium]|nr:hypothetical protein [Fibromonadales bacterium]
MTHFRKILALPLLLTAFAPAANTVAVLEIVPSGEMTLKFSEYRHLTDELRTRAREALPGGYTILTRDNIMSLLPPDSEEAQCLAEACAVEIGRAIGAEYVTQGLVGEFGGMLTLTVELYESISGNLLGSFVTESKDVMGLLKTIREKAPDLFARMPKSVSGEKLAIDFKPGEQPKKIDPQIGGVEKKSNAGFWVALALDALGAGLIYYGYAQNSEASDRFDDYMALEASSSQFGDSWKKVEDARLARNISYVAGGVFLAAGIGVHIWF